MHTALVSRLLKDKSLWEETSEINEPKVFSESLAGVAHTSHDA
jgi:hypothetical protein